MADPLETIDVYLGDTTVIPVEVTTDNSTEFLAPVDPTPVDLTGHTLSWLFCATKTGTPLLQTDVTNHSHADAGESSLTITPANLVTIGGEGQYYLWCIEVDENTTEVTRCLVMLNVIDRPARS